jgi:hypothetical protein
VGFSLFIWVKSLQFAVDDCDGTLSCSFHEIIVGFVYIPVYLQPLDKVFSSNCSKDLELLVPVALLLGLKAVQGNQGLAEVFGV